MNSPPPTLREWLARAPFTLTLSSGFFGFFAHAGFAAALEQEGLAPARVTGSSAGALVAGLWASGRDVEDLRQRLFELQKIDFWDPGWGAGLLKGDLFARTLDELLGAETFAQCRWPVAISVFELGRLRTRVVNAGPLNPAIRASCALPGLFHPVRVENRWAIDGGVLDRSGLAGAPRGARVLYHHLGTRSKVRRHLRRLSDVPWRADMWPVVIDGLPRVGPNRLHRGPAAFAHARDATLRALDAPTSEPR
jgi:NTE family protein